MNRLFLACWAALLLHGTGLLFTQPAAAQYPSNLRAVPPTEAPPVSGVPLPLIMEQSPAGVPAPPGQPPAAAPAAPGEQPLVPTPPVGPPPVYPPKPAGQLPPGEVPPAPGSYEIVAPLPQPQVSVPPPPGEQPSCGPVAGLLPNELLPSPPCSPIPLESAFPPEPPPSPPNPVAALGEQLQLLAKNLTVTTADENWKLVVFGTLNSTAIFNSARPVAPGTPLFLAPEPIAGFRQQTLDMHARASSLGGLVVGPRIGDWHTGGLVLVFFYNDNIIADRYGILPFLIWADIKNDDWRFAAGLQLDIFNPAVPNMLVFSYLFASGNAGNYRGQFRVERYLRFAEDTVVTVQAGLGEPIATIVTDTLRLDEDNGWPNVECRVALGLGPLEGPPIAQSRTFEVGVSGLVGQVRRTQVGVRQTIGDVWGVGADLRWRITDRFGVAGEVYAGQGLGTYNAGILQTFSPNFEGTVHAAGAWCEVYYYLCPEKLHTHVGYGIDDPLDRDLRGGGILRNETYFANIIWDVTKYLRLGFETTYRQTAYPLRLNNEGVGFQTVVQMSF
jgi:hypothetical protein